MSYYSVPIPPTNVEIVKDESIRSSLIELMHPIPILWDMSSDLYGATKRKAKDAN